MKFFKFILFNILLNINALTIPPLITRRSLFASTPIIISQPSNAVDKIDKRIPYNKQVDKYAHWSFFGLVAPPIEKTLSYEKLLEQIKYDNIVSVQIAVQHDCVIATTTRGHRLSCLIPDNKFQNLLMDSMDKDGNIPFRVIPMDPIRAAIREAAQFILISSSAFYIAADLDIIKIDTTAYNSIKEREEAYSSGKPPKKFLKSILQKFIDKPIKVSEYDEALDKVFGINRTKIRE
tara:strand:+ start:935 stop:1639 length:705 start_codon:yes stop_codon:yes gene_type:complete